MKNETLINSVALVRIDAYKNRIQIVIKIFI